MKTIHLLVAVGAIVGICQSGMAQESEIRYPSGVVYVGTLKNGIPDGKGYYKYPDGSQYEGGVSMGKLSGSGEMLYANGNDYKGEWKDGKRDGAGVMTYILGGRYEGGWKDGRPSGPGKLVYAGGDGRAVATVDGVDPNRTPAPARGQTYALKEEAAPTGSLLKRDAAREIPVPPERSYAQLSPQEQASVNSWFPALAPGDEPPYPLHGPAEFYQVMSKIVSKTGRRGSITVYVTVGKDGKVASVRAVGLDDPQVSRVIALAAGTVQYKPARCAGQPCEMAYPFRMALTLE